MKCIVFGSKNYQFGSKPYNFACDSDLYLSRVMHMYVNVFCTYYHQLVYKKEKTINNHYENGVNTTGTSKTQQKGY